MATKKDSRTTSLPASSSSEPRRSSSKTTAASSCSVARRRLALDDRLPHLRALAVERGELSLRVGHVVLGEDRLDRALGHAQRAVDALVGVDHQHVRPLAEAVDRADVDAVRVLAFDAAFSDNVSHLQSTVYHLSWDSPAAPP